MDHSNFKLAGVMGWPVAHSRSPLIHNHWIAENGLKGVYVPLAVHPDRLREALRGLPALGFAGCNLTVPHKESAMQWVDSLHAVAKRVGAVNTVVVMADGSLHGMNTDGMGYIQSLRDADPTWRAQTGPALVLGAGGAARAIVVALIDEGVPSVRLCNRTDSRAHALAQDLADPRIEVIPWHQRNEAMHDLSLLVNTTTQGMNGYPALDLRLDGLPIQALVSDVVYVPLETPLLAAARQRGNRCVNGLGMLINQARGAFEVWFGVMPQVSDTLRVQLQATF